MDDMRMAEDDCIVHLRRRSAGRLPVMPRLAAAGHRPRARSWSIGLNRPDNIMLILDGRGEYRTGSRSLRIEAPCLFQHRSGCARSYGPDPVWDEVFLCYPAGTARRLADHGLWSTRRQVLPLSEDPSWLLLARGIASLVRAIREAPRGTEGAGTDPRVEALDQAAIAVLRLSHGLARAATAPRAVVDDALGRWMQRLAAEPGRAWAISAIAADLGWSLQHLRRRWRRRCGATPDRWLREWRLRHGRHLLSTPGISVGAAASGCGFADPLHFSRLFSRRFGQPPSSLIGC